MTKPLTDIEIARAASMAPIQGIAEGLGIDASHLELYGPYKAKVQPGAIAGREPNGKLILVSAITPTPAGEGKTTTTVGLGQALGKLGRKGAIAVREPSLGPCMGIKGGATGGGYAQVVPMEDINLHFTGDLHAITTANNLLSAMVDNHIHFRQSPTIDPRRVTWRRVMDMNERSLRNIVGGLGGPTSGVPRETGFDITAASEIMAALCLAENLEDLKARLGRILVGYSPEREPIRAEAVGGLGALAILLRDAMKPNLVQTLAGTPAFVHGGPFANIAHGTSSVIAAKTAMSLADYVITEAGFGFDLGGEKFFDIFCRSSGLSPSCVVMVATVRALKMHGGVSLKALNAPDAGAVERGLCNLERHLESAGHFGVPLMVVLNRFTNDTDEEVEVVMKRCAELGVSAQIGTFWADGGEGGIAAAEEMIRLADGFDGRCKPLYPLEASVEAKITTVAQKIYGADKVEFTATAKKDIAKIQAAGLADLPVCMAKTQKSLSDDATLIGRPTGFSITVREIQASAGAGFLVPITGEIMRMPGLPRRPAAVDMDLLEDGTIVGLS